MQRGEIWWASMLEPRGAEPGYHRPVVIVSSNAFNKSFIQTVVVAIITSNLRLADAPGNFKITHTGLSQKSVVNISQIITLDKSFLTEKIGKLTQKQMVLLNDGIKLVFDI